MIILDPVLNNFGNFHYSLFFHYSIFIILRHNNVTIVVSHLIIFTL